MNIVVVDKDTGVSHTCPCDAIMPVWMGNVWGSSEIDHVFIVRHNGKKRMAMSHNGINYFINLEHLNNLIKQYHKIMDLADGFLRQDVTVVDDINDGPEAEC